MASDQTNGLFVLKADNDVSVQEVGVQDFKVYPNPLSGDKLNISIFNQNEKEVSLRITNTIGVEVYNATHSVDNGINAIEVQLPDNLKQGIYFVTITGRISNICKKVLKP